MPTILKSGNGNQDDDDDDDDGMLLLSMQKTKASLATSGFIR